MEKDLFSHLLCPLTLSEFELEFWERQPHCIQRKNGVYFRDLFTAEHFDNVLEYGQLAPPALRVVKDGETPAAADFLQADGRLDLAQLRKKYVEGHTIVINGLEKFWQPVSRLVQVMQEYLSFRVQANAYLTPNGSQGLRPHYDSHNVLVAQLSGAKTWRVYHEVVRLPQDGEHYPGGYARETLPEPQTFELQAGDVLYIPRGWIHDAEANSSSSLHLTLGIHPPLWHNCMAKALEALTASHEGLRRPLPIGYLRSPDDTASMAATFDALKVLLAREGSALDAVGMLHDEFIRLSRGVPDGRFVKDLDQLAAIDLHVRLVKKPHLICRIIASSDNVALQFSRSMLRGPPKYAKAMDFISRRDTTFSVLEIPGLDDQGKVAFAQELVREGLLRFEE